MPVPEPMQEQVPEPLKEPVPEPMNQSEPQTPTKQSEPVEQTTTTQTPPATQNELGNTPPAAPASKRKFPIPTLISPHGKEKKKKWAGMAKFLSGIGQKRTSEFVEMRPSKQKEGIVASIINKPTVPSSSEQDRPLAASEQKVQTTRVHHFTFKKPTKQDYVNVPDNYVPGRPLVTLEKLRKFPTTIKRLHDWYMRASSVGVDAWSVFIPSSVFNTRGPSHAYVTFEDFHLMFNMRRLDCQLVTLFAL